METEMNQEVKATTNTDWKVKAIRTSLKPGGTTYYVYYGGKWLRTKANQLPGNAYVLLRRALNKAAK
jgi:hypothetical protein